MTKIIFILLIFNISNSNSNSNLTKVRFTIASPISISKELNLNGTVSASTVAEVRSQITGTIRTKNFEEGRYISQGEVLYQLNNEELELDLQKHMAMEVKYLSIYEELANRPGSPQALIQQADADLRIARISLEIARNKLNNSRIKAPISGHITEAIKDIGSHVGPTQKFPLAKIQVLDPIYIEFKGETKSLHKLASHLFRRVNIERNYPNISIHIERDQNWAVKPKKLFGKLTDISISSDEVTLRAQLSNPELVLLPGAIVKASLETEDSKSLATIPKSSIRNGRVWVLDSKDILAQKKIKIEQQLPNNRVAVSGIEIGEQVAIQPATNLVAGESVDPIIIRPSDEEVEYAE